jgi:hypothetical protein
MFHSPAKTPLKCLCGEVMQPMPRHNYKGGGPTTAYYHGTPCPHWGQIGEPAEQTPDET